MNYAGLVKAIATATTELQGRVASFADQALVIRNWLAGAWIVEFEQQGKDRARYGERLLESLANDLRAREVKGLGDPRVLRDCRVLYRVYPQIRGSATRELGARHDSGGSVPRITATRSLKSESLMPKPAARKRAPRKPRP